MTFVMPDFVSPLWGEKLNLLPGVPLLHPWLTCLAAFGAKIVLLVQFFHNHSPLPSLLHPGTEWHKALETVDGFVGRPGDAAEDQHAEQADRRTSTRNDPGSKRRLDPCRVRTSRTAAADGDSSMPVASTRTRLRIARQPPIAFVVEMDLVEVASDRMVGRRENQIQFAVAKCGLAAFPGQANPFGETGRVHSAIDRVVQVDGSAAAGEKRIEIPSPLGRPAPLLKENQHLSGFEVVPEWANPSPYRLEPCPPSTSARPTSLARRDSHARQGHDLSASDQNDLQGTRFGAG